MTISYNESEQIMAALAFASAVIQAHETTTETERAQAVEALRKAIDLFRPGAVVHDS